MTNWHWLNVSKGSIPKEIFLQENKASLLDTVIVVGGTLLLGTIAFFVGGFLGGVFHF